MLAVTVLPVGAWAIPGDGMARDQATVDLPDLPVTETVAEDAQGVSQVVAPEEVVTDPYKPESVDPWTEDSGVVDLTGVVAGATVPVEDLPIELGVPKEGDATALAGEWQVDLAAPETSQDSGVSGLIMKITPPATVDPEAEVALTVDTSAFTDLYGPLAAERFGLMVLPDCVYDSPGTGDCAATAPADDGTEDDEEESTSTAESFSAESVETADIAESTEALPTEVTVSEAAAGETGERLLISADVPVESLVDGASGAALKSANATATATSSGSGVVGALDTGASVSGDYTASPLLSSGSWAAGSSSGAFTYAYDVQVPEVAGGLTPKVGLSYSSQSVDGRTSATNNQASWIGDGWDYSAGSITRTYANCRQDSKKSGSNNAEHRTGDLCWGSENATLSLGGSTTELVWDDDQDEWVTAAGDGSRVELLKDTGLKNGDEDGEYWVVTTTDGTRYHFGLNHLPGWTDGAATTNSVLTVPVYGNHSGEPCYQKDWTESACTQAWRWSLDYVEDVHGNAMSLWWARETNYYARNFNFKAPVKYHRGGYLKRIDYGQRKDTIFSANPLGRVAFTVAERCISTDSAACTEEKFTSKNPGDYRSWYDTPADLRCASGEMCWNVAPSFFTRKRLTTITTSAQRTSGSTALQAVDKYALTQSFPVLRTGSNTALWLESITRTGYGTDGASIALNPVRFEANLTDMPNRVLRGDDDPRPTFSRLRIGRVINEYRGETAIEYSEPVGDCATGTGLPEKDQTAALKANSRLCYPVYWHPDESTEEIDWFHKYVVTEVEELPNVDGVTGTATTYDYSAAAWKLAEQEFTKKATRTYSEFAGFQKVTTITGIEDKATGAMPTKSVTRYFRGTGDGVTVEDVAGAEIAKDRQPFAGRIAEQLTYSSAEDDDGDWLTRSVTYPEAQEIANRERADGLSDLRAWRVHDVRQVTYTRSSGTGDDDRTLRKTQTDTTYEDVYGLPVQVESTGDTGRTGDESCTRMEYLHVAGKNIIGLSKQVRTSPSTCAAATFDTLTTLSGATRTAYDGLAYGTAPSASGHRGLATQTWSLTADGSGFQSDGTTGFDAIGRVTSRTDPDGKTSTITYQPSGGQAYTVTETNSLGQSQTRTLDPGRGVTLQTVDLNNLVSGAQYDALGRLAKAWGPGRSAAAPDFSATYTLPDLSKLETDPEKVLPPFVTTTSRGHDGNEQTSVAVYDGLGRERQTQQQATGGGRLVTDTLYNASGEVRRTNNAYLVTGDPVGELFIPDADTVVPNATEYAYDGLGRVTQELPVLNGSPNSARVTRYAYGDDWSSVINPSGGVSYRLFTDALGRTSRVDTFTDSARTEYTTMRYTFDEYGQMVKATSSADTAHPWTWSYDLRGRQTAAGDPDSGTSSTTYDSRDRVLTSTNARGITVWNKYDQLSRPVEQRLTGETGTLLNSFTYDTAANGKGQPASVTRYTDTLAYTQSIAGYTTDYQPTATTLSIPSSVATTWGLSGSYTYSYRYTDTGLTEGATLPAVGNLPAEQLVVRYNTEGLPLSVSGKDWYGSETVYSPYGQVVRSTLGSNPYRVWNMATYDDASGALTKQETYREQLGANNSYLVSSRGYGYDDAGNVTSIRENATAIAERQCFTYDPLGQLTKAWTSKDQTSCAAGTTNSDGTVNVAAGTDGTGYWQEYEYDLLGNRTELVEKDLTGATAKDATTTYAYGQTDGSQPHALTKVTRKYTTTAGAAVTAEAKRLYELTGETTSITSVQNGDAQQLTWTYDGQVEKITGAGSNGKTPFIGLSDKCLDLKSGAATASQPVQLYACNGTVAQKWGFVPVAGQSDANLGTVTIHDNTWCLKPAANTSGSALQIQKCDGTAAQQFKRVTATGQLSHPTSGLCVAVKDAATADGTAIVLATCSSTATAQQWQAQNETRHIYGPGGARLMTVQGKQATLHLGESEITVLKGGALVHTQRSYAAPGGTVLRYAYGSGTTNLVALAADHQGTVYAEVLLDSGMTTRIHKQDPFGNQRGASTVGLNAQNHTGFLGSAKDDASGFALLGARLYDPVVGRFLSVDPVLDIADPLQSNGYGYAHNNPVTHADPSGLAISLTASEMAAALAGAGLSAAEVAQAQANSNRSLVSVILSAAWSMLADFIGINDAIACFGGDMWSCGSLIIGAIPWGKIGKIPAVVKAIDRTIAAIQAWKTAKKAAELVLAAARAAETAAVNAKKLALERAKKAAQAAKKKAADKLNTISNKAVNASKKTGNSAQRSAQASAHPKGSSAASSGGGGGGGGGKGDKPGGESGASHRSDSGSSGGGGDGKADGGGESCTTNSFVPGTKVLMADGSTKPIEQVEPGDEVTVTDPESGETRTEQVTAAIEGTGAKRLVRVTIDTDGDKGSKTAEITATDGHPFWVEELGEWVKATDLTAGQLLRTSAGTYVQITAITHWTEPRDTVHNLTVSDIHTYYVLAGAAPILVHNCGARAVDMHGNTIANPDPLAARLVEHTNTALSEWNSGALGYSLKDQVRIALKPSRADTIKGSILDGRVKELAGSDSALGDLFSTPNGYPGPDWVNTGRAVPGVGWYDLTTTFKWGQHVFDYAPKYGPGIGILWK
ncbi:ricin-type beta-trefoil lectin domain protein [Actinoplanes sp. NPDC051851]|uniref:ricin-type beta-trefoil lectin domain protein n=1 Tax=Actinoplanes sp. NPDC051851 TaxID=3154753 RepID=UPI00343A4C18